MLHFQSDFVTHLPGDPETRNHVRPVQKAAWSRAEPTPVARPTIVAGSEPVARMLGLPADWKSDVTLASILGGNTVAAGSTPYAACYGGHQFGHWAGQLGDGRAITLGEVVHDGKRWEVQLKGAGPTPYSRRADGRAVLRSSIREFLCSEAMAALGVPTTRALALLTTGDKVVRDMFYDGRPEQEPGAIVVRVAPSFLRFGNFEIFASRNDPERLRLLFDYAVERFFPQHQAAAEDRIPRVFTDVCTSTARMVAHWMAVGFVHGVMNTDNMSILGLTIDYGPYGWLDDFDPDFTPNTTDHPQGRYRYRAQPDVALWNLSRLAGALHTLHPDRAALEAALKQYETTFNDTYHNQLAQKVGLERRIPVEDDELLDRALGVMATAELDMTLFFRGLSALDVAAPDFVATAQSRLEALSYNPARARDAHANTTDWLLAWQKRLGANTRPHQATVAHMNAVNPRFTLRNYVAQQAIDAAHQGDFGPVNTLLDLMRNPFDEHPDQAAAYGGMRPEWALNKPGCSALSCSS